MTSPMDVDETTSSMDLDETTSSMDLDETVSSVEGVMMAPILLHGTLHVTIFEIKLLHTTGQCFTKLLENCGKIVNCLRKEVTRLYVTIDLEKVQVRKTKVIGQKNTNIELNESFHIYCAHVVSNIIFTVKDNNTLIGRAYVPVEHILNGQEIDEWIEILDGSKIPLHGAPKIHVKLHYIDVTRDPNWNRGIGIENPKFSGVPNTFFPQREGCKVSLYQDAHVPDNFVPEIHLAGGQTYQPNRCWEDVFDAITGAKHIIYITGWSVYPEISLVRDPSRPRSGGDTTLGELLKRKAEEGVTVLMLVWDDRTSIPLFKNEGLMATHDEETIKYFHGTEVHCVSCPRKFDDGGDILNNFIYTHHQKTLVVDSELPTEGSDKRGIVSFVGGLDLCDGRYDTPFHSLFRTLDTVHRDDFYQPNFPGSAIGKGGPREPWHDIHARLEGTIARDVLSNFEQRWSKQGKTDVPLRKLDDIIIPPSSEQFANDHENWNVQLFRSIDGGAANFGLTENEAAEAGLVSEKDQIVDHSIQDAYINAIRRAKKFIYIENQYFLGSSFAWSTDDDIKPEYVGASHLIPKELSLKIVSKIMAKERFMVYIVVPMWPEGVPESPSVQAILYWQRRTMEMMYKDVVQALDANGIVGDPRNYLTFLCLGNREVKKPGEYQPPKRPNQYSDYMKARESRRFMIYVHAKMMIVDDEYIIIGSANINQRSMDGARDTEIAMGAYQPNYLATENHGASGQIHRFRMSLWFEHLGRFEESFLQPQSEECIRRVNQLADKYWDLYSSDSLENDLPGHLLRYPVAISPDGTITKLPTFEFFPDTKAPVLGDILSSWIRKIFFPNVLGIKRAAVKRIARLSAR